MTDDKLLAEIEARAKAFAEGRDNGLLLNAYHDAGEHRAALLAIVRRQQSEITSLTHQCASMAESFAGAVKVNDHLRGALLRIEAAGDIAMPYANWEPTMQWAMDELSMVKKIARKALGAGGNDE